MTVYVRIAWNAKGILVRTLSCDRNGQRQSMEADRKGRLHWIRRASSLQGCRKGNATAF